MDKEKGTTTKQWLFKRTNCLVCSVQIAYARPSDVEVC